MGMGMMGRKCCCGSPSRSAFAPRHPALQEAQETIKNLQAEIRRQKEEFDEVNATNKKLKVGKVLGRSKRLDRHLTDVFLPAGLCALSQQRGGGLCVGEGGQAQGAPGGVGEGDWQAACSGAPHCQEGPDGCVQPHQEGSLLAGVVVGCAGCFSDAFHFDFIPPPLPLQLESLEKTHALVEAELKETKAREEKLQTDVLALKKTGKGQSETALLKKQLAASKVAKDNAEKALEANSKTAEAEIKEKDALIAKCVCGCYAGVSTPHADSSFSYTGKPRKSRC